MKSRNTTWMLGLTLALLASVAVAESTKNVFFSDDGERFDLADLYDGETRYFGSGEHEIQATREGDNITITFGEGERTHEMTCSADADGCAILTIGDEGKVMILKTSSGTGRIENLMLRTFDAGENRMFFGPSGPHGADVMVQIDGDGPLHWVSEDGSDAIVEMEFFGGNRLRCPEGDTTMRLDDAEDSGPYYCPQHNLELEKVEPLHRRSHERMVIVVDEDDR